MYVCGGGGGLWITNSIKSRERFKKLCKQFAYSLRRPNLVVLLNTKLGLLLVVPLTGIYLHLTKISILVFRMHITVLEKEFIHIAGSISVTIIVLGWAPKWVDWDKWWDKLWYFWKDLRKSNIKPSFIFSILKECIDIILEVH